MLAEFKTPMICSFKSINDGGVLEVPWRGWSFCAFYNAKQVQELQVSQELADARFDFGLNSRVNSVFGYGNVFCMSHRFLVTQIITQIINAVAGIDEYQPENAKLCPGRSFQDIQCCSRSCVAQLVLAKFSM